MKTLIIYATKYGCTEDCADYLKTKLTSDTKLIDINKTNEQIALGDYDTIIIGGSVYIGSVSKKLREFCESNLDILSKKNVGIFLCSAQTDLFSDTLKSNFPAALLESVKTTKLFGSEARFEKMKFFDKLIIKAVTKGDFSKFKISNEKMDEFVTEITG